MNKINKRVISIVLICCIIMSCLSGCGSSMSEPVDANQEVDIQEVENVDELVSGETVSEPTIEENVSVETDSEVMVENNENTTPVTSEKEEEKLTAEQKNSINMLNHVAVLTQEIESSKHSRLFLEEAYATIRDDMALDAVDTRTLVELTGIMDMLENYRIIDIKRERLQYVYEQSKAQALKAAVPNPLGLLSGVNSTNLLAIAGSIAYMAIDSATNYNAYMEEEALKQMEAEWVLDDEEAAALHNCTKSTFEYMVEMVNEYKLPGNQALNAKSVNEFIEWKSLTNVTQKIDFFEANEETYKAYGGYWLTLSECYFENEDYEKCINAIEEYKKLDIQIYRKDYDYAKTLPLAIAAAEFELEEQEYIDFVEENVTEILGNTDKDDWVLQYFAAQTYIDLYSRTEDQSYLQEAYDITRTCMNYQISEQKELNATYFADIVKIDISDDMDRKEKNDAKEYNKVLIEARNKELIPVYEPLLLTCELLFALADELDISTEEKQKIDKMLHNEGEILFLEESLDNTYRFFDRNDISEDEIDIKFTGKKIILPAKYVTDSSIIKVTVRNGNDEVVIEDWAVKKVDRKKSEDINDFTASFESEKAKEIQYKAGTKVTIQIKPHSVSSTDGHTFQFEVVKDRKVAPAEIQRII